MRAAVALALGLAATLALPSAAAAAPTVETMVVGRQGVLRDAKQVRLIARTVRVDGGRRCTVGARTPLGVLAGTGQSLRVRDYGSCSRSARDAGGLYVRQVGSQRERGRSGWVYKVGRRNGTNGAGDPSGPFGNGGLRRGARVLWFWCELSNSGCQRTLEVRPSRRRASAGERITVRVLGHDDRGRGVPVAGATVRLAGSRARTGADGRAVVTMPSASRSRLTASKSGLVRSFPVRMSRR